MKKSKKPFLNMDERNRLMAYRVMAVMYLITIFALQVVVLYRQFALGQEIEQFEDFAAIMTFNSLFLISALLYFGAIPIQKLKIRSLITIYLLLVFLGSAYVFIKYRFISDQALNNSEILNKIGVVAAILGIIMGSFVLFSWLGKRRIEKELN